MEEVQSYKLVIAKGSDKLSEKVNEEIKVGFLPHGSPVISSTYIGDDDEGNPKLVILVGQAMTMPFDDEDSES